MKYLYLLLIAGLMASCQPSTDKPKETTSKATQLKQEQATYPPIPQEILEKIYNEATGFDALYSVIPVTISQVKAGDTRMHALFLGPAEVPIQHGCTMDANILFHDENGLVADLQYFFTNGCNHAIYMEEGRPKYGGVLNPQGLNFYQSIILEAQQQAKKHTGRG